MAGQQQLDSILFENTRLVFRNFRGRKDKFNAEGQRNFGAIIPETIDPEAMLRDGWNVKYFDPREDDEDPTRIPWLPNIKVNFDSGRPPQIYQITSRGRELITADTIDLLDGVSITNVDLVINPSFYEAHGRSGIAAYAKTMYVTIDEDPLEAALAEKYSSPSTSIEE